MEENKSYYYLIYLFVFFIDWVSFENLFLSYILISSMFSVFLMIVIKVLKGKWNCFGIFIKFI